MTSLPVLTFVMFLKVFPSVSGTKKKEEKMDNYTPTLLLAFSKRCF